MPPVRLLHPIQVLLRKAEPSRTAAQDPVLKEPIGQVRRNRKPIRLLAQISDGKTNDPVATAGGVNEDSDGYLLFRTQDLRREGVTVERGDRVVQIGSDENAKDVDYYITKLKYMGHYPNHKGPSLVRAYYADRQPSRIADA